MKVLHVSSGNLYGGVETLLATLARERAHCTGMEPRYALCFEGRLADELSALGVPAALLGPIRSRYPWQAWRARRRLAALLRQEAFDAVVCHMPWSHAIFGPVVRQARVPLVFWMHDAAEGRHWVERWAGRCPPDLAICNSRFTAASLSKLFPRGAPPQRVIYYPVSAPPLDGSDRAAVRAALGTSEGACVIIQVSRMEPYKGGAVHLDALGLLADVPGWVCWMVGGVQRPQEARFLADLQARAARTGIADRVRFLGERRDVRSLLRAADVFCQPNLRGEPFGIVFIEALQAGLPVVATSVGGALEIVDKSCGRLARPGDAGELARILQTLAKDDGARAKLGGASPARAAELCDPISALEQLRQSLSGLPTPPPL